MTRDDVVWEMARQMCCPDGRCVADAQNNAYQSSGYQCMASPEKMKAALARAEELGHRLMSEEDIRNTRRDNQ